MDLFLVLVGGISNLCLQFYNFVITFLLAAVAAATVVREYIVISSAI